MRTLCCLVLAVVLAPVTAPAATRVFLRHGPYGAGGDSSYWSLAAPDAVFSASGTAVAGVYVSVQTPAWNWSFTFEAPTSGLLGPGTYEHAEYTATVVRGAFRALGPNLCFSADTRFVVHEVTFAPGRAVTSFSAEFDMPPACGLPPARGTIRFRAGDATCASAADGTPCNDGDACSATSSCRENECVAGDVVACGGGADACHDPMLCDPVSGLCSLPSAKFDGAPCDDGQVCSAVDACRSGECVGWAVLDCDDQDPCTLDSCDTAGCVHAPLAGTCGHPGAPSTWIYIDPGPGRPFGLAQQKLTAAEATFQAYRQTYDAGEAIVVSGNPLGSSISVELAAPRGSALVPGTYEPAYELFSGPPTAPSMRVLASLSCAARPKRFVVHDLAFGPSGEVRRFAADFTLECTDTGAPVRGAVRYRTGDDDCAGVPDGSPCDDLDACTTSSCQQGLCVATTTLGCAAPAACQAETICDPLSGACPTLPYPLATYSACDDGTDCTYSTCEEGVCVPTPVEQCTPGAGCAGAADDTPCEHTNLCMQGGMCRFGECLAAEPRSCDDGNPCTDDTCDPATGCAHAPAAGDCWHLEGRWTRSVSTPDVTCSCTSKAPPSALALYPDGRYARTTVACDGQRFPDEKGMWRSSRRRIALRADDSFDELFPSLCISGVGSTTRRGVLTADRSGERLQGSLSERARITRVALRSVTRVRAVRGDGVLPPAPKPASATRCLKTIARCLAEHYPGVR